MALFLETTTLVWRRLADDATRRRASPDQFKK